MDALSFSLLILGVASEIVYTLDYSHFIPTLDFSSFTSVPMEWFNSENALPLGFPLFAARKC